MRPDLKSYHVLGRLASGGMGDVWVARRTSGTSSFEKLVVIKTIRAEAGLPSDATQMFVREARIAALLSHPNCVQVFELGEEGGTYFIAMEYLDGFSLARVLRQAGEAGVAMPIPVVARIAMDAAAGLHYAHELEDREGRPLHLVHRDVSLDNLIVTFTGQTKLIDFGIARAASALVGERTQTGVIKGKSGYLAPEYLRGASLDARVDVFALGVVLFRALTGDKPFAGEHEAQVAAAILEAREAPSPRARRPELAEALDAVVTRALAPDPERRFATARELRTALAEAVPAADGDRVADYLATLWPDDHPDRRALKRLVAGEARDSAPVLDPMAASASRDAGGSSYEAATTPATPSRGTGTAPGAHHEPRTAITGSVTGAATVADSRERPRSTRPRWLVAGGVGAVAAAGAIAMVAVHHRASRSPATTPTPSGDPHPPVPAATALPASGPLHLLVADFANHSGDAVFDSGTLEQAFTLALEAMPTLAPYSREAALKAAAQLRPGAKVVEPALACAIAARDHVPRVLAGTIEKRGATLHVRVELRDGASCRTLASEDADVATADAALKAVPGLAGELSKVLGATDPAAVTRAGTTFSASPIDAVHEYMVATRTEHAGDLVGALPHFQRALEIDPAFAMAYTGLAVSLFNDNRMADAEQAFRQGLAHIDRMTERQRLLTLGLYYQDIQGDLASSIEVLSQLVQRYPAEVAGAGDLAIAYCERRDFARAIELTRRNLADSPIWVDRVNVAIYEMYSGDEAGAIRDLEPVLAQHPKLTKIYQVLALAELVQGHVDAAVARWQELSALGGDKAAAAGFGLADVALYQGRIADAADLLARASTADLAAKSSSAAALDLVTLGYTRARLGQAAAARQALDQALATSQEPPIRFWAARTYIELGDDARAGRLADQLATSVGQQRQVDALILEAERALAHGKPPQAIERLEKARGIIDTWLGRLDLARAYLAAHAYAEASEQADLLVKRSGEAAAALIDENPTGYLMPQALYYQARALEGLGSPEAAERYRQFLAIVNAEPARDPLARDARARLTSLESAAGSGRASHPTR